MLFQVTTFWGKEKKKRDQEPFSHERNQQEKTGEGNWGTA